QVRNDLAQQVQMLDDELRGLAAESGHVPTGSSQAGDQAAPYRIGVPYAYDGNGLRSEEHTSELQSLTNLVCRLLLAKKKTKTSRRRCAAISTRRGAAGNHA